MAAPEQNSAIHAMEPKTIDTAAPGHRVIDVHNGIDANQKSGGRNMNQTVRRDNKVIAAATALASTTDIHTSFSNGIVLEWKNLEYSAQVSKKESTESRQKKSTKKILFNLSGRLEPGQFMAVMGPEGSGKSLLLKILGGRLRYTNGVKGHVTYNGGIFSERLRRNIGFLESFVLLQENLTVKESLLHMAQLCMPPDTENIDRIVRVEHVLDSLELTQCADTIVGKAGGALNNERRRLATGLAMISNPNILILDEPTSGLDGALSLRMTRMLAAYAAAGRTVIASFNMPSHRMFELFTHLLLLAEGNTLYQGPANEAMEYFQGLGHVRSPNISPGEYLLDLAVAEPSDASIHYGTTVNLIRAWRMRAGITPTGQPIERGQLEGEGADPESEPLKRVTSESYEPREIEAPASISWLLQTRILLSRNSKAYRMWDVGAMAVFGTVVATALLTGCLWYQRKETTAGVRDKAGLLFFVMLYWSLLPMISTVLTFYQDRNLLIQEQDAGLYPISAYFASRVVLFFPYEILPPLIFGAIVYWMASLSASFWRFVLFEIILVVNSMVASSIGLAVGSVASTAKQAIWIATVLQILSLLSVDFLVLNMPDWCGWVKYLSFSTYVHKLLLRVTFPRNGTYNCSLTTPPIEATCKFSDDIEIEGVWNVTGNGAIEGVILVLMLIGYRALAFLLLWRGTNRNAQNRAFSPTISRGPSLK